MVVTREGVRWTAYGEHANVLPRKNRTIGRYGTVIAAPLAMLRSTKLSNSLALLCALALGVGCGERSDRSVGESNSRQPDGSDGSAGVQPVAPNDSGAPADSEGPSSSDASWTPGSYELRSDDCGLRTIIQLFGDGTGVIISLGPAKQTFFVTQELVDAGSLFFDGGGQLTRFVSTEVIGATGPNCGQAYPYPGQEMVCEATVTDAAVAVAFAISSPLRTLPWEVGVDASQFVDAEEWIARTTLRGPGDIQQAWSARTVPEAPDGLTKQLTLQVPDWTQLMSGPWEIEVASGVVDGSGNASERQVLPLDVVSFGPVVDRLTAANIADGYGFDPVGLQEADGAASCVDDCLYASSQNGPGGAPYGWLAGRVATKEKRELVVRWRGNAALREGELSVTIATPGGDIQHSSLSADAPGVWTQSSISVPESNDVGVFLEVASQNCNLTQLLIDYVEAR